MTDLASDLRRVEKECGNRKQTSDERYNEIRQRLHDIGDKLQQHELQLSSLVRDKAALKELVDDLRDKFDELDDIIRGKGPNERGLVEMIGDASRVILEIRRGQESVAAQRAADDKTNKNLLHAIEDKVDKQRITEAERSGGYTLLEKIVGIVLLLMSFASMGASLGWWGSHH